MGRKFVFVRYHSHWTERCQTEKPQVQLVAVPVDIMNECVCFQGGLDEQSIKKIADTISDIKNASKQQVSSCLPIIQVPCVSLSLCLICHISVYDCLQTLCLTVVDLRIDCDSSQISLYPVLSDLSVNLYHIFKIVKR